MPTLELNRLTSVPILRPIPGHPWEAQAVFNAGAVRFNGRIHLIYRAVNQPFYLLGERPSPEHKFVSALGHAVSEDGLHFQREDHPVLVGEGPQEDWGVEDPRLTYIDGRFQMLYTAFGGRSWDDVRISRAVSTDLRHWEKKGVVLAEPNKDAALFPARFGGEYVLVHRREPSIWLARSRDLRVFTGHRVLLGPRPDSWEELKIGLGPTPIAIPQGWLLIYHGVDRHRVYRLGLAILDRDDPSRVLYRHPDPILSPELPWEREGLVPNVVFSCGAVEMPDAFYVYYGGADTALGVAALPKSALDQ